MKRSIAVFGVIAAALTVFVFACKGGSKDEKPVAGAVWYNYADTYIATTRTTLNKAAEAEGIITIREADSQGDIATQTSNINNLYSQGINFLVLNNINFNAKVQLIQQAKEHDAAILFVNTDSPSDEEYKLYDRVYHVSALEEQSGEIMAQHAVKYWKAHPEADRNGNGKLDYIMLLGIVDHNSTQIRSRLSIQGIQEAGIQTNLVQEAICGYQRGEAQNQVASILQARRDDIEFIFACNDDMALGAIEALKAAGFFKDPASFIPVISVDATAVAVEAVKEGTLLGTALNNPVTLGNAAYKVVMLLSEGKEITDANINIPGTRVEGHHVYLDFKPIDAGNVQDASY
ncbi:MAG: galactose ABC transporter substrate-binding protein [Treponema sp.]|jgi:methyl-galactoside transport system substrate-binding protein|nr:galactose ABC transporter substrate-binding protein [Treponema sp.]